MAHTPATSDTVKTYDLAIIGSGAAGTMAFNRGVLNNDQCILFTGSVQDQKRSRAKWVGKVENVPGHLQLTKAITQPGQEMISWLTAHPQLGSKATVKTGRSVVALTKVAQGFLLTDQMGDQYQARYILLATGVMDVQPFVGDSIKPILPFANKQQVDYCLRCDGHHAMGKSVAVIGPGEGALWTAIILKERYQLTQLVVVDNRKLNDEKQPLVFSYGTELDQLLMLYQIPVYRDQMAEVGDKGSSLKFIRLERSGEVLPCELLFVSCGTIVYHQLALALGAQVDQRGYVIADASGQTNIDGLYVAGDLRAGVKKQIYTAWDTAVDAVDHINARLRVERRTNLLQKYLL